MTKWMNANLWKMLAVVGAGLMAWAVLDSDVDRMKPAIAKNEQSIEAAEDDIVEVEKDIIGVKGSLEALRIQQKSYHLESDEKLDKILDRLPVNGP